MALVPHWLPHPSFLPPLPVPPLPPHPLPPTWPFSLQQLPSSSATFFPPSAFSLLLQPCFPLPNVALVSRGSLLSSSVVSLDFIGDNPASTVSCPILLGTSCMRSNESVKAALNLSNIHCIMEQIIWFFQFFMHITYKFTKMLHT